MMILRKSEDRGRGEHGGWLKSQHTFSFADYYDPQMMGFSVLRVINEDYVKEGMGFGTHPHRDMEIITVVVAGSVRHKDSMGNGTIILPGEVQRMSAGTGVRHSEFNPSSTEVLHLLQIWIEPDQEGHAPSYEQKSFAESLKNQSAVLAVSRDGRDGSLRMNQDASLWLGKLRPETSEQVQMPWMKRSLQAQRNYWIQVISGEMFVATADPGAKRALSTGDGAALANETLLSLSSTTSCEFLFFDLP